MSVHIVIHIYIQAMRMHLLHIYACIFIQDKTLVFPVSVITPGGKCSQCSKVRTRVVRVRVRVVVRVGVRVGVRVEARIGISARVRVQG